MRASSPLHPLDTSSSTSSNTPSNTSTAFTPSCEWDETLDHFSGLLGVDSAADVDLNGLDQFLMATADDFLEPFAGPSATPDSPIFGTDEFFYEQKQDLNMLQAAGFDTNLRCSELQSLVECKLETETQPLAMTKSLVRHRKRKTAETHRLREADKLVGGHVSISGKKMKQEQHNVIKEVNDQAERTFRRRYDTLHGILEAWNTGGIEDLEEIADNVYDDDVTLISPDYSEGLRGVEAVMSHWNLLLDAFPDGIMEEYIIQREEGSSEKMKATWTFSGTQIYPIFGVQPRHKKVCISGKSFFTFKGDRIRQIVLSWNYRETLLKLMGVQSDKANGVVLSACANALHPAETTLQSGAALASTH